MVKKALSIYWSIAKGHRRRWLLTFITQHIFFIFNFVVQPYLAARFVSILENSEHLAFSDFYPVLGAVTVASLIQILIGRVAIFSWIRVISETLRDIDLKSFQVTLSQSSAFFANNFTGSLTTMFNRFTRSFDLLHGVLLFDFNALVVQIVFPFIILMFIAPLIGLVFLGWTVLFAVSLIYFHKKKIPRARKVAEYDSRITGAYADSVTNILSIKMFSSRQQEEKRFGELSEGRVQARMSNLWMGEYIRIYKSTFIAVLQIAILAMSGYLVVHGQLSVAEVVLIQFYVQRVVISLWDFGKVVERLEEALADATEMAEVYQLLPTVNDVPNPDKFGAVKGLIELKNVDFTYEDGDEQAVFERLNLTIPVGQKIGVVGPSGGGKTTLTKLLLRFMDVSGGQILLDGQDISQVAQDDLRQQIAYVPQEPLLFHRTIYDNIAYGDPAAKREDVLRAARLAHADEFIERLPKGYDTLVGERGVKLSGGQKQRVAIARAMLKKSPVLLLDEATSALDSKSEKLITGALDDLMKSRTTIVIAHRLSTIRKLDRIIVMHEGGIVEDGAHDELLEKKGLYAELWGHQQGDFLEN